MINLITVYITTLNRPELLERALISVKAQTYKNFEVVVCNDDSDEEYTLQYDEIIERYRRELTSLTYLVNSKRMGACFSRNRAIEIAKGNYITGLDDDDIFDKYRLESFLSTKNIEQYSFLCSNTKKIGNAIHKVKKISSQGKSISFEEMKNLNLVGNQVFIKTEKIRHLNGFDPEMPAWQDYDMWFRLMKEFGPCYKISNCTMYLDDDIGRNRITTSSKAHQGYLKFVKKHSQDLNNKNIQALSYIDLVNRKQRIPIFNKLFFSDFKSYKIITKYQMTYRFSSLYKIYQFFLK